MSAGRISRSDYEYVSMQRAHEYFKDQTMKVEACEECSKNTNTRLLMWKSVKSVGTISSPDYEFGSMQRVHE